MFRCIAVQAAIAVVLAAATAGCSTDLSSSTTSGTTSITTSSSNALVFLKVVPGAFLGTVPCSNAEGALRSYVVTLVDVTTPHQPFTFASSLPTPCSQEVRFDDVIAGHAYAAEIDGYALDADEICPIGCVVDGNQVPDANLSGTRHMQDLAGNQVEPRWITACGEGDQDPTIVENAGITALDGCDALEDTLADPPTAAVLVDPMSTLGQIKCASDGVTGVAAFDVYSQDGLGNVFNVPCLADESVTLTFGKDAGLIAGEVLRFRIEAHAQVDAEPAWGAECLAGVVAGLTTTASCGLLSDKGSIALGADDVLGVFGVACSGEIGPYDVVLKGGPDGDPIDPIEKTGIACTSSIGFAPLPPGGYGLGITLHDTSSEPLFCAICTTEVLIGGVASPACTTSPCPPPL